VDACLCAYIAVPNLLSMISMRRTDSKVLLTEAVRSVLIQLSVDAIILILFLSIEIYITGECTLYVSCFSPVGLSERQ
jgi:hypothetical protein